MKKVDDDEIGVLAEVKSETGETGDPSPDHKMSELDGQLVEAAEKVASESHLPGEADVDILLPRRRVRDETADVEHKSLLIAHAHDGGAWRRECVESGSTASTSRPTPRSRRPSSSRGSTRGKVVAVCTARRRWGHLPLGVSRMSSNDTPELWGAMRDAGVDVLTSNLPPELEKWREAEVA